MYEHACTLPALAHRYKNHHLGMGLGLLILLSGIPGTFFLKGHACVALEPLHTRQHRHPSVTTISHSLH